MSRTRLLVGTSLASALALTLAVAGCQTVKPTSPAAEPETRLARQGAQPTMGGVAIAPAKVGEMLGKTDAELAQMGMSADEIAALRKDGPAIAADPNAANPPAATTTFPVQAKAGAPVTLDKEMMAAQREKAAAQVAMWLKDVAAQPITAKDGGVFRSADGSLEATIPPGALTADAQVRVAAVDTSSMQVSNFLMPGIRFALDLGDARITPDMKITVRSKADPRTIADLQKRDKDFTPEKYSLSKGTDGAWYMTMPVNGPSSKPGPAIDVAALTAGEAFALFENGSLPVPTEKTYSLKKTWSQQQFEANYGLPAPNNMSEWFGYEGTGLFDCGTIESNCWGLRLLNDLGYYPFPECPGEVPPVEPTPPPPGQTPAPTPPPATPEPTPAPVIATVPVHVSYTSDDPAVNGGNAAGATVRFDTQLVFAGGGGEFTADGNGYASTQTQQGNQIDATAYINIGPRNSQTVRANAQPGMAAIELQVEKNSPRVTLDFESDAGLGSNLTVKYSLDGEERTEQVPVNAGDSKTATASFFVRVPSDNFHGFKILSVNGVASSLKEATPASHSVMRNASYRSKVELFLTAPK